MSESIKSIVVVDLMGYSLLARSLEEALAPGSVLELNHQIQHFVDHGIKAVDLSRAEVEIATTGDGAILAFPTPLLAVRFSEALHAAAKDWNSQKTDPFGLRYFRVGIATGPIEIRERDGHREPAGFAIARAVRLEAKAAPGAILIDEQTYKGLARKIQKGFSGPEPVPGKRDEMFTGYRLSCDQPPARVLSAFAVAPAALSRGDRRQKDVRKEIVRLLRALRPVQYEELIFLLMIPIDRRPPRSLPMVERRNILLEWVEEIPDGITDLHEALNLLHGENV